MIARHRGACIVLASFAVAAVALQPGCGHTCTDDAKGGLNIIVRDARTGVSLCDSSVVAFDGSYREELRNLSKTLGLGPCRYSGAVERPGNYRVEISCAGYQSKQLSDLAIYKLLGDCHIRNGISLTVDLEPDPNAPQPLDAGTAD